MIVWREKFFAFSVHFVVTLLLAAAAAALIFLVWFPDPFQSMLGGSRLFLLVVGCDLALGPLVSLVIYNRRKSKRELLFDYAVVGAVQVAALVYGVWVMSNSRPVYVTFVKDRLEVITANEIEDADLEAAHAAYRSRPKWGPQLVGTQMPTDVKERSDVLFSALSGKDLSSLPRYYVTYDAQIAPVKDRAQPLTKLMQRHSAAKPLVVNAAKELGVSEDRLRWLPVKHRRGFWTALIDADSARPLTYLPIDPY